MGASESRDWVPIPDMETLEQLLAELDQEGKGYLNLSELMNIPKAWAFVQSLPVLFYFDELKDGRLTYRTFVDAFRFFQRCKSQLKKELTKREFKELMKRGVSLTQADENKQFGQCSAFRTLTNLSNIRSVYVRDRAPTSYEPELSSSFSSSSVKMLGAARVCVYGKHADYSSDGGDTESSEGSAANESTEDDSDSEVYPDQATATAVGERMRLKMFKELTVFLSEDGTREEFMQWLWHIVDFNQQNHITIFELSVMLKILQYDNIYLSELSFSNVPGVPPEQRIMSEFDSAQTGYLSHDHFIILADLITREYEYWESRHLESVGNCELGRIIGKGASGIVRFASNVDTHERYALKIVKKGNCAYMSRLDHEIESLKVLLRHPHVVQLEEVLEDDENMYLRMELLGGGSLVDIVRLYPENRLPEEVARYYVRQVFQTLAFCHKKGICHRDVRLENLLLDNNAQLKLGDFGQSGVFSAAWDMFSTTLVGSIYSLSPEQVLGMCYSGCKIDVWSAGVAMYCMLVGHPPFYDADCTVLLNAIVTGTYETPIYLSSEFIDLLAKMINVDPEARPSFDELLQHPWFSSGKEMPPVLDNLEIPVHPFYMRRPDLAEMIIAQALYQHKTHFHLGEVDENTIPDGAEGMWCLKCHFPSLDLKFMLTLCTRNIPVKEDEEIETDTHVQDGFAVARDSGWPTAVQSLPLGNPSLEKTLTQYPYKRHVVPANLAEAAPSKAMSLGSMRNPNSFTDISGLMKSQKQPLTNREAFLSVTFQEGEKGTFVKLCRKLKSICDESLWEAAEKQAKKLLQRGSLGKTPKASKVSEPIPTPQ